MLTVCFQTWRQAPEKHRPIIFKLDDGNNLIFYMAVPHHEHVLGAAAASAQQIAQAHHHAAAVVGGQGVQKRHAAVRAPVQGIGNAP
jgi:hypothetical protein